MVKKKKRSAIENDSYIHLFDYNVDFETRTLYYGNTHLAPITEENGMEVNDWSSENFIKGLHLLDSISHEPITVIWSSDGGEWDAGMAVYEFIRLCKSKVTIISYSRCRSMGSIIMQAADERILTKNSTFMIHYGMDGQDMIHSKDFEIRGEQSKKMNKMMEDIYLKRIREVHPGYTRAELQELMKYDCYMTAKEAVELGLADKVI